MPEGLVHLPYQLVFLWGPAKRTGLKTLKHDFHATRLARLFHPSPSIAAISRLSQAGVVLVDTRPVVLEMMADSVHPKAQEIYAALAAGLKEDKEK